MLLKKSQGVSITNNPYEGLKQAKVSVEDMRRTVSITNNPYEGLKLRNHLNHFHRQAVSITNNPYEGLKHKKIIFQIVPL